MLFYQGHLIYLKVATVNERRTKHTPVLCRKCSRLPTASFFCAQMYAFAGFLFLCLFCFVLVVTLFCSFVFLLLIRRVFSYDECSRRYEGVQLQQTRFFPWKKGTPFGSSDIGVPSRQAKGTPTTDGAFQPLASNRPPPTTQSTFVFG